MAFFAKIFLAIKPASLMMFWSLVLTDKNEFDWYFWHSVFLSFYNGSSIFNIVCYTHQNVLHFMLQQNNCSSVYIQFKWESSDSNPVIVQTNEACLLIY